MKQDQSPFKEKFDLKLSKKQKEYLMQMSHAHQVSMRTLIMRAFFNEANREDAFEFEAKNVAHIKYDDIRDTTARKSLHRYLRTYPKLSLEDLVYLWTEIPDMMSVDQMLVCFYKLFDDKLIIEDRPFGNSRRNYVTYVVNTGYPIPL